MRRVSTQCLFFLSTFLLALVPSFAADQPSGKPNVILITLDTVRADRMGFLGAKKA